MTVVELERPATGGSTPGVQWLPSSTPPAGSWRGGIRRQRGRMPKAWL